MRHTPDAVTLPASRGPAEGSRRQHEHQAQNRSHRLFGKACTMSIENHCTTSRYLGTVHSRIIRLLPAFLTARGSSQTSTSSAMPIYFCVLHASECTQVGSRLQASPLHLLERPHSIVSHRTVLSPVQCPTRSYIQLRHHATFHTVLGTKR